MPWESWVSQIAMWSASRRSQFGRSLRGTVHCVHTLDERIRGRVEDPAPLLGVVAVQAYDEWLGDILATLLEQIQRGDDAVGHRVARRDAAEYVDEPTAYG